MPLCEIASNAQVQQDVADAFLADVESSINKLLGKPTQYIMASLSHCAMRHNGSSQPSANVRLHSIGGINSRNNNKLCTELSALCQKHLGVSSDRVFFQFVDTSPANFGIGSQVFG
ncbi:macrophage migration inhibitory factor [Cyclospora cayetanensis]|uniref:L-dopachrome isomerase n=2 Tax=Cyclospora cayetanensis TaxID=88456 RepID=A0A1D3D9C1_9EIME|nr:macrophage migration inhibitory factor [Cyclospora cayetanensis]OEH80038.1 macrophage migration inhibitory factor [Cyclospora cayetanensis]